MAQINAIAHLNELTKDVTNDYYLTPQVRDTLYTADIIRRIAKREIATKNVDGEAFVNLFIQECIDALAEGYNVVTDLFRASTSLQGVVLAGDLGHTLPAGQIKVSINLTQNDAARKAIENTPVYVFEQSGATGPVIQSIFNPATEDKTPNLLRPGKMVLIQGMRLAVKGDDPTVGVLFTSVEEPSTTVLVPPTDIYPNTATKLQFTLPAEVTEGDWTVSVTTQGGSNSANRYKTPRTYVHPETVVVGEYSGDDDERPGGL